MRAAAPRKAMPTMMGSNQPPATVKRAVPSSVSSAASGASRKTGPNSNTAIKTSPTVNSRLKIQNNQQPHVGADGDANPKVGANKKVGILNKPKSNRSEASSSPETHPPKHMSPQGAPQNIGVNNQKDLQPPSNQRSPQAAVVKLGPKATQESGRHVQQRGTAGGEVLAPNLALRETVSTASNFHSSDSTNVSECSDFPVDPAEIRAAVAQLRHAQQNNHQELVMRYLQRFDERLERMEKRISNLEPAASNKGQTRQGSDTNSAASSGHRSSGEGGPGNLSRKKDEDMGQLIHLMSGFQHIVELVQTKLDRLDSRVELYNSQLATKVDQRSDETQTLLAEVMERAHRLEAQSLESAKEKQSGLKSQNAENQAGHPTVQQIAQHAHETQQQPLINVRELAMELTRELTSAFATWTTTVVEELAKAFQRLTTPFHQKVVGEVNSLQEKALEVLVALADLRNSNARFEHELSEGRRETSQFHEATSEKLTRLRDDIYQQASASDRNFESMKLIVSQHFHDVEAELRHNQATTKEIEARVYSKLAEGLEDMLKMSDSYINAAHHNISTRQMNAEKVPAHHQELIHTHQHFVHGPAPNGTSGAVAVPMQAIFPTGIPAPSANFYPPHLMVAGGNAQQQSFYPFFQPLNGTQQQLREGNKPLEGLDQQQKQMREIVGDTAVTTTSEVEDTRNRSAGVKFTGGASRQHSGMDRASLASSRGSTFIQEQGPKTASQNVTGPTSETDDADSNSTTSTSSSLAGPQPPAPAPAAATEEEMRSLRTATASMRGELAKSSARLDEFEAATKHFTGKIRNMYSELFDGHTKLSSQLRSMQESFDLTNRGVSKTLADFENLIIRVFQGGTMPALAETEKMIKRRLKELTRTIDERFLSLRVDLNVLTKKSENAEVRERHLSATLESALELLHNVVRNSTLQCRADQTEIKLLLSKHHEVIGTGLDNATSAIYGQTDRVLRTVQGIRELFDYFYRTLAELANAVITNNADEQHDNRASKERRAGLDDDGVDGSGEEALLEEFAEGGDGGLNETTPANHDHIGRSSFAETSTQGRVEGVR